MFKLEFYHGVIARTSPQSSAHRMHVGKGYTGGESERMFHVKHPLIATRPKPTGLGPNRGLTIANFSTMPAERGRYETRLKKQRTPVE